MTQAAADLELTSSAVHIHVRHKPACRIEMDVKTNASMVKTARKNALKAIGKEVAMPGFRKGKAPEEMILKKFPHEVEKQVHKEVADLAFVAAQKLANIPLLNNDSPVSFDLKSKAMEEGAEIVFSFETEPTIPSVDRSSFAAKPVARAEVGEKQIEEAIRQMRFFYARWTPVEDRAIQNGDFIMIDLDTVNGEQTERVFHHIRFEVSKERMAHWMQKLVEGAKAGDVLEGISEADETATEAEKAEFKPKNVRITILKVEQSALPELDDAFAKKVGAETIEEMKKSIEGILKQQVEAKALSDLREQVNDFLIANYPFDLPQSLVDTEKKHRFGQLAQDPKFKAGWDKRSQKERQNLNETISAESAQAVRIFYLSRQIVRDAQIPVTHQEVQNEAVAMIQSHGGKNVEIDQIPKEIYALALSKVILAKAQDYVLEVVQQ